LQSSGISGDSTYEAAELLNDAYRMLLAYYPPIQSHALHVYESAVATMPQCALFETVDAGTTTDVYLISARQNGWTATLRIIEDDHPVTCIAFSPDGTQLASGSSLGTVRLWSARTGAHLAILKKTETVDHDQFWPLWHTFVTYSPDGTQIGASSCAESKSIAWLALWDTRTYQQLVLLRDPRDALGQAVTDYLPVAFLPTGSSVVYGCNNGTVCVWVPGAKPVALGVKGDETAQVFAVACSADGSKIVSALGNGKMRVWNSQTGANLAILDGHGIRASSLSFSPDGAWFVTGFYDRTIRIWDMRTNEIMSVLHGHSDVVTSVAFSPDGRQVVSGSDDKTVRIWDVQSNQQIAVLQGHTLEVKSVSFSPDGARVASGSEDCTIRIWDIQALLRSVELLDDSNSEPTKRLAISLNGAHLVSTAGALGRVWDVQTGQENSVLDGHTGIIWHVAFSPDSNGLRIVTGSWDNTVRVWNTQTGQELARFSVNDRPCAVALSAEGVRVVAGLDNATMLVWDVSTGKQLALFVGHQAEVTAVALSCDGLRVVSASYDKTSRLWDVPSGKQVAVFSGHEESVLAVAFSPDGMQVVSSSFGTIRVWDTVAGAQIALLETSNYHLVTSVAFSYDGDHIYASDLSDSTHRQFTWHFRDTTMHQSEPNTGSRSNTCPTPSTTGQINKTGLDHTDDHAHSVITCNQVTGWLSCTANPHDPLALCWLPVERRGEAVIRDRMIAMGGTGGKVTMLDLTGMIERLHSQGIMYTAN
jgi:WD40 repeat protein